MNHFAGLPDFDAAELSSVVENLNEEQIDALEFGAIRLDEAGKVRLYSRTERVQSGSGERERVGRDFFAQVAPCMDNEEFRGRIERARAAGRLDIEFSHVGDFADEDREMTIRVQSASGGGIWIFLRRDS